MIPPIKKSIVVPATPEQAFQRFTKEIGSWWPLASHSIGGADAETCVLESRVGGRLFERLNDGTTHVWGSVTVWDPPREVAFTWHVGHEPSDKQTVTVSFSRIDAGTRVQLVHAGWEDELERRNSYDTGWDFVLARYTQVFEVADSSA